MKWHRNGRDVAFSLSSARSAYDVYVLDARTGKVTRWTESELGGIVGDRLVEPTLVRWKSFDGLEISGFYYPAPKRFTGKRPVIVLIHGGPEAQERPDFLGRWNYWLEELGVAIILPNVRGSTGYGKSFVKLDNGMTLAVATNYPDRICCALEIVGISNFVTFLENTESYRRDLRRVEYGDERDPETRAFMERIAPVNNAHRITKPLFVVQGANDPRVPRSEAEQMVRKVRENGRPVWYLLAMDEGHGFAKKANNDYLFYAAVLFVRQFLLGEETAALP